MKQQLIDFLKLHWKFIIPTGISVIALLKDRFLLPAKIEMFVGDELRIVHGKRPKIHLDFNFTNIRSKLGVINKLRGELKDPNRKYQFVWNLFYKLDGATAVFDHYPTSIAVLAKNSVFQGIEFLSDDEFKWGEGKYKFYIEGWCNRGLNKTSNMPRKVIEFYLSQDDSNILCAPTQLSSSTPVPMIKVKVTN